MAINSNPISLGALAALAGMQAPYMNLPLHDIDYSKGPQNAFEAMKLRYAADSEMQKVGAQGQSQMAVQRLQDQNALMKQLQEQQFKGQENSMDRNVDIYKANMQNELGQAQLGSEDRYRQGQLGLGQDKNEIDRGRLGVDAQYKQGLLEQGQGNLDINKGRLENEQKRTMIDAMKTEVENMSKMSDMKLKQLGLVLSGFSPDMTPDQMKTQAAIYKDLVGMDDKTFNSIIKIMDNNPQGFSQLVTIQRKLIDGARQLRGNKVTNPWDNKAAEAEFEGFKESSKTRETLGMFKNELDNTKNILKQLPEYGTGPGVSFMGLNELNPKVQELKSPQNALALTAKEIYKLGSGQGFTDADRDFLTEVVGNTAVNKYSLEEIMNRMEKVAVYADYKAWEKMDSTYSRTSPDYYEDWKVRPENQDPIKAQVKQWVSNLEQFPKFKGKSAEEIEKAYRAHLGLKY